MGRQPGRSRVGSCPWLPFAAAAAALKEKLWRAAVDQGFGGLVEALALALREAPEDPLDRLRAGIGAFVVYSGEHPELLGVMNSEGALNTPRLDYVFDTYIGPATAPLAVVLDELAESGLLRRVPLRPRERR